jgi:hypothetical protein
MDPNDLDTTIAELEATLRGTQLSSLPEEGDDDLILDEADLSGDTEVVVQLKDRASLVAAIKALQDANAIKTGRQ